MHSFPSIILAILALVALVPLKASGLESTGTDFTVLGPNRLAPGQQWQADRGSWRQTAAGRYQFEGAARGQSNFRLPLADDGAEEFFFSARVRSPARVVFYIGGLSMSYHRQGEWQQVCGLLRVGSRGAGELRLAMASLDGSAVTAEVEQLEWVPVSRPAAVVSRPPAGETALVVAGQPAAIIVYPHNDIGSGQAVQAGIEAAMGIRLPLLPDTEVTRLDWPVIKREYRNQHLILIGRLATNRAIWASYNRFLSAVDGYYPGGDGFVVRTAADVFGNGRNHLIVGGSSEAGVSRAVEHFLRRVNEAGKAGRATLPWLLEVELNGACEAAFAEDRRRWQDRNNPALAAMTSGYGKVTRWYENAMGYYWSGGQDYLQRAREYLDIILHEQAHTHHYIVEFFVRTSRMLRDSPVFDMDEINRLDALILQNFLDFLTVTDLNWMTVFSPPYENIRIVNRHQIAPWYGDLVMARYLAQNVVLSGRLQQLVQFRESEKASAFRHFAASRHGPSLPGIAAGSDYEEIPASFFRFALEDEQYEAFFGSGLAEQALVLNRLDNITGRLVQPSVTMDLGMWLGALAHLTGDGRYQWIIDNVPIAEHPRGAFQGRYVAGVHRYQSGGEIEAVDPGLDFAGIVVAPQPHLWQQVEDITYSRFPQVAIRGGLGPEDDYIVFAGVDPRTAPGVIVRMTAGGMPLLGGSNLIPGSNSRLISNGADSMRIDSLDHLLDEQGGGDAQVEWLGAFPNAWAVGIETPLSPFIDWARAFIRLDNGSYVFIDTFTAKQDGEYILRTVWQPAGGVRDRDGAWEIINVRGRALLSSYGAGFNLRELKGSLIDEAVVALERGERATVWTLLQKSGTQGYPWEVSGFRGQQMQLRGITGEAVTIHHGPLENAHAGFDAAIIVERDAAYAVFGIQDTKRIPAPSIYLSRNGEQLFPDDWQPTLTSAQLIGYLDEQLQAVGSGTSPRPAKSVTPSVTGDGASEWKESWAYTGLQRPALTNPRRIDPDTVDFGEPVSLVEIRSRVNRGGPWNATHLPERIWVAPAGMDRLPLDGEWIEPKLKRVSRPGIRSGNYGEAHPVEHADEAAFAENLRTRFVRAEGAAGFSYFIDDRWQSRHPVSLRKLQDGTSDGLILASNVHFPQFVRAIRDDDIALALLQPDGSVLTELEFEGPVQSILVADQQGTGDADIFVLKADARLQRYDLWGEYLGTVDMQAQHEAFNAEHGRPNTRHPAGGHRMPFTVGLWQGGNGKASKLYVSRYGSMSFHDEHFELEGVLNLSGYAYSGALESGYDFSGDGLEEAMIVERFRLMHFGGSPTPRVRDPGSARFWPEVYEPLAIVRLEGSSSPLLGGPEVYEFRRLESFGNGGNYVILARGDFVGLYDGAARRFVFSWAPETPLTSASVLHESSERLTVGVTTIDGILWQLEFGPGQVSQPHFSAQPLNLWVNAMQPITDDGSQVLLCADQGLFVLQPEAPLQRIRAGKWMDGLVLTDGKIVAADAFGGVYGFTHLHTD